jgi:hypothetical protein
MSMLPLASAVGVNEFLGRFRDDAIAVVAEPIDQRADGRVFLILDDCGVVERAQQIAAALKFVEQALEIDIEAERLRCRVEIGAIDKQRDVAGN